MAGPLVAPVYEADDSMSERVGRWAQRLPAGPRTRRPGLGPDRRIMLATAVLTAPVAEAVDLPPGNGYTLTFAEFVRQ
jgi:hypothetical protein